MNRRQFLLTAATVASVPRLKLAADEPVAHAAPYLSLAKFIEPGSDEFTEEKIAAQLVQTLNTAVLNGNLTATANICPSGHQSIAPDLEEAKFIGQSGGWHEWLQSMGTIQHAQFHVLPEDLVKFEITSSKQNAIHHTTGHWKAQLNNGGLTALHPLEQQTASAAEPFFRDVTEAAFRNSNVLKDQLCKGIPYWRSRLDPATGIDLYGSNGIAVGDIDNDGADEVYVCQPGGIPNRLLKFQPDGTLSDITSQWNAHMLDDTSAALFLDLRNSGRQDLVILRSGGPVLLLNEGSTFRIRTDAFDFKSTPQGGFTGMAAADYDRDGKLDLYLCCYVYFQSEAQYTYAAPYHDARNGPPNFLFRNKLNADGTRIFRRCHRRNRDK